MSELDVAAGRMDKVVGHIFLDSYQVLSLQKEQQTSKVTCKIEGSTLFCDCFFSVYIPAYTSSRATDPHRETYMSDLGPAGL